MHALAHHDGGKAQAERRMEKIWPVMSAAGRAVSFLGYLQYALVFRREPAHFRSLATRLQEGVIP